MPNSRNLRTQPRGNALRTLGMQRRLGVTAFNVVRFRVKPGREQDFIEAHRTANADGFKGARRFVLIRTGDSTFCAMGEWESFDSIVDARPKMIGLLDGFRDMLEDLGNGLG